MPFLPLHHAATLLNLSDWSTLSRNEIRPFLARFGIKPLGKKYPILRVYMHLLGISPQDTSQAEMLGKGLVRVSSVAARFGVSSEHLLKTLRLPHNGYPPLYVFGPKRNLMLRAQVEQMLSSPKNEWTELSWNDGYSLPASQLARHFRTPQTAIDSLLADKAQLPAHIISEGRVRYICSDVRQRLTCPTAKERGHHLADVPPQDVDVSAPPGAKPSPSTCSGSIFAEAVSHAANASK